MPTLDWIGKQAVVKHLRQLRGRTLRCDPAASAGDPESRNLIVQGDNLEALKALLPFYGGQVKLAYLDPPYNTGNKEWKYNDNVDSPEIQAWLREAAGVGPETEDLSRHDKWLCMMYPRLAAVKRLLRSDGLVFVSIDENELAYLQILLDEIFGRVNHVGTIIWKNVTDNNPTRISTEHEYVVCYANDIRQQEKSWKASELLVKTRLLEVERALLEEHRDSTDEVLQKAYTTWLKQNKVEIWPFQDYKFIDRDGIFTGIRGVHNPGKEGYRYDVLHNVTGRPTTQPMMGYRFAEETMRQLERDGRLIYGKDENKIVELKVYAKEYRAKLSSLFELDGRAGTNDLKGIFPEDKRPFDFPKPVALIQELLAFTTSGDDIVLDSFAGSGTTAHAVLAQNQADGGHRQFILVESMDYARTLTAERVRRVATGYAGKSEQVAGLGGGFRFCTLGGPLLDAEGNVAPDVTFSDLARHVYFSETQTPLAGDASAQAPFIGQAGEVAYYLLPGADLGAEFLEHLRPHCKRHVVFADSRSLDAVRMKHHSIDFRMLPYDVRQN